MARKISYIPGTELEHRYLVVFSNDSYIIGIRLINGEYRVRIIERNDGDGDLDNLTCKGDFTLKGGDHISCVCKDVVEGIEIAAEIIGVDEDNDDDDDGDDDE